MNKERILGCLFGMALGDALGADTEFLNIKGILEKYPPYGPQAPMGNPALVTDDTQMALAVGEALIAAPRPYTPARLSVELEKKFVEWYDDPKNNRAPGRTCIAACEALVEGKMWLFASDVSSKGCGANMRVQPVGLLKVDAVTRAGIAQLQAAITHGHPTGLAAADLTAWVIADLAQGGSPDGLAKRAREYANSQREVYHDTWLLNLWERVPVMDNAQAYIRYGWDECLGILDRLDAALATMDRVTDPCLQTGAGWIAEEAFGTALLCFLLYPNDPTAVIRRAAVSSGDSDSIACIAGAFAGACHGIQGWNAEWISRIEYRDRIQALGEGLYAQNEAGS